MTPNTLKELTDVITDHGTVQPENADRIGRRANEFQTSQPNLQVCALAKFSEGLEQKIKGSSWELIQECGDPWVLSRIPQTWAHFVKALVEQANCTVVYLAASSRMQYRDPAFSGIYAMNPGFKGTGEVKLSQQSKQQAASTYLGMHTHTHTHYHHQQQLKKRGHETERNQEELGHMREFGEIKGKEEMM